MEWLLVLGLAVWVLVIQIRLLDAERHLRSLQALWPRLVAPNPPIESPGPGPRPAPVEPAPASTVPAAVAPAEIPETPFRPIPAPAAAAQRVVARPAPVATPAPERPRTASAGLSIWLAENGLAWLGGGALVLGGAFLVAYAAQRGFFTPALRVIAAIILGSAFLGAGEWLRRQSRAPAARSGLVPAILSGAGASTLYAAVWAAYALYHFIPVGAAAALLGVISLGLLALALIHNEALALLAIAGGFIVPLLCNLPSWNGVALDGYLVVLVVTGLASIALQSWSRAGLLTLILTAVWVLLRDGAGDLQGASGLLVSAFAVTLLTVRNRATGSHDGAAPVLLSRLPAIVCCGASLIWVLFGVSATRAGVPAASLIQTSLAHALLGSALVLLCAAAVRMDLVDGRFLGAPAAALMLTVAARVGAAAMNPVGAHAVLWFLAPIMVLAASGLAMAQRGRQRDATGVIAVVASVLSLTALRPILSSLGPMEGGLVFAGAALLLLAGAAIIARASGDAAKDLVVAAWIGAATEALGLAIHAALGGRIEPLAYGGLGFALALAARGLPWRGLPQAAAAATLVSLFSMLGPKIAGAAMVGRLDMAAFVMACGAGVVAQGLTWQVMRGRTDATASCEAISTIALMSGFLTIFVGLHTLAIPHGAVPAAVDPFAESALRTLLLLTAGLALSLRPGSTPLSSVRGPLLLAIGALHGVLLGVLVLNPWWGWTPAALSGPPVFDMIALAYLAPALILAEAARRALKVRSAPPALIALTSLGYLLVWAVVEIRRLFHGPALADGPFTFAEIAAYGVALLGVGWIGALAPARAGARSAAAAPYVAALRWIAVICSTYLLCVIASPWWGPLSGVLTSPLLFFALIAAGALLTALFLARGAAASAPGLEAAIKIAVALQTFSALTLAIRYGFHGAAMRTPLREASVETWTFSAAWALYGLIVLVAGARGGDRILRWVGLAVLMATTLKVFLFDMATLEGVVRAASFLALGVLLLVGALAARRLRIGTRHTDGRG